MRRPVSRQTCLIVSSTVAGALVLAACGSDGDDDSASGGDSAETITVSHAQGETEVPLSPESVITFDMASLDTLNELGVESVEGVPQESVPDFLSEYAGDDYINAGTLFEPDYEAVSAAEPDLIIVAGRSSDAYDELSDIAPTIDVTVDSGDFFTSFREQTETLAEVFEEEAAAEEALDALDERIEELSGATADAGTGLVVLTTGGDLSVYGPGSRFGLVHDVFGVEPADEDLDVSTHGEVVSFEYVAQTDPDWMFVIDRDDATGDSEGGAAEQVLDNELVAETTAWQEDQVIYLDPESWYIVASGLSTVGSMIGDIENGVG